MLRILNFKKNWCLKFSFDNALEGQKRDVEILSMPTAGSDHVKSKNGVEMDEDSTDEYHEVKEVLSTSMYRTQGMSNEQSTLKKFTCRWKEMLEVFL